MIILANDSKYEEFVGPIGPIFELEEFPLNISVQSVLDPHIFSLTNDEAALFKSFPKLGIAEPRRLSTWLKLIFSTGTDRTSSATHFTYSIGDSGNWL